MTIEKSKDINKTFCNTVERKLLENPKLPIDQKFIRSKIENYIRRSS